MSYSFHAYQAELFPTSIRARAVGFVYSWSRFSAIFTAFLIAAALRQFGSTGVFVLIAGAIIAYLGGYGNAAMTIATIYVLGIVATPFLPETLGKPLPK